MSDTEQLIDDEPVSAEETLRKRRELQAKVREQVVEGKAADVADLEPLSLSTVVGHGPSGVQLAKIGGKKIQVGPYTMSRQPLAVLSFQSMSIATLTLCLAWSLKNGEGELTGEDAVKMYKQLVHEDKKSEVDEESVRVMLGGAMMGITDEEIDAVADAIFLSALRYDDKITPEFIKDNLDFPEGLKLLGKILSQNTGLSNRFFEPSSEPGQTLT